MSNSKTAPTPTIEFNMRLEDFLATCFLTPMGDPNDQDCIWGLPLMLHGSPGIGKTARIRQASAACGLQLRPVELGGRQPEDASGVPFVDSFPMPDGSMQKRIVIACTLAAVNELNSFGTGVLFMDELTCARPATQGAFLTCIQERRVGDVQFARRIRVVAAGNPPDQAAGGYILQPPMANRMAHRDVGVPSVQEFRTFLIQGANSEMQSIEDGERQIMDGWPDHFPQVKGLITGFLEKTGGKHLFSMPKQGDQSRGKAWPSPRTLEYATRAVAAARILGRSPSEQTEMFASCVGMGAAVEWEEWIAEADLPEPEHVLKHGWKIQKNRLDRTVAVFDSMTAYVMGRPTREERLKLAPLAWKRIGDLLDAELPDSAISPAVALARGGFSTKAGGEIAEAARPIMIRFGKKGIQEFVNE